MKNNFIETEHEIIQLLENCNLYRVQFNCRDLEIFSLFFGQKIFIFVVKFILNHPSIFYTRLIRWSGCGGLEPIPAVIGREAGPGQVASPSQGHTETNNYPRSQFKVTN